MRKRPVPGRSATEVVATEVEVLAAAVCAAVAVDAAGLAVVDPAECGWAAVAVDAAASMEEPAAGSATRSISPYPDATSSIT